MYQAIVDKDDDRNKRVKRNAEVSLSLSKLPPRMEAYESIRKEKAVELERKAEAMVPSFKPAAGKPVPDFKRQHKEFAD
jgi:hypothetical protein